MGCGYTIPLSETTIIFDDDDNIKRVYGEGEIQYPMVMNEGEYKTPKNKKLNKQWEKALEKDEIVISREGNGNVGTIMEYMKGSIFFSIKEYGIFFLKDDRGSYPHLDLPSDFISPIIPSDFNDYKVRIDPMSVITKGGTELTFAAGDSIYVSPISPYYSPAGWIKYTKNPFEMSRMFILIPKNGSKKFIDEVFENTKRIIREGNFRMLGGRQYQPIYEKFPFEYIEENPNSPLVNIKIRGMKGKIFKKKTEMNEEIRTYVVAIDPRENILHLIKRVDLEECMKNAQLPPPIERSPDLNDIITGKFYPTDPEGRKCAMLINLEELGEFINGKRKTYEALWFAADGTSGKGEFNYPLTPPAETAVARFTDAKTDKDLILKSLERWAEELENS